MQKATQTTSFILSNVPVVPLFASVSVYLHDADMDAAGAGKKKRDKIEIVLFLLVSFGPADEFFRCPLATILKNLILWIGNETTRRLVE